jgi:hypothetical protein
MNDYKESGVSFPSFWSDVTLVISFIPPIAPTPLVASFLPGSLSFLFTSEKVTNVHINPFYKV